MKPSLLVRRLLCGSCTKKGVGISSPLAIALGNNTSLSLHCTLSNFLYSYFLYTFYTVIYLNMKLIGSMLKGL